MTIFTTLEEEGKYEVINLHVPELIHVVKDVLVESIDIKPTDEVVLWVFLSYFFYLGLETTPEATQNVIPSELLGTIDIDPDYIDEYLSRVYKEIELTIGIYHGHKTKSSRSYIYNILEIIDSFLPKDRVNSFYSINLQGNTIKFIRYSYQYVYDIAHSNLTSE